MAGIPLVGGGGWAGWPVSCHIHTQGAVRFSLHGENTSCVLATILSDEEVSAQFNQYSRKAYKRSWGQFVEFLCTSHGHII
jgi:hypothetical protein